MSSFFFLLCKLLFIIKDRELDLWLSQVLTWQTWIGLFILNGFDFIKPGHLWFLPALLLAINNSDISISEKVASLGDKYSLYVYIFHLAVAGVLSLLTKKIGWYDNIFYLWGRPIVVIVLTIIFSMCFHRLIHGNMYRKLRDHVC